MIKNNIYHPVNFGLMPFDKEVCIYQLYFMSQENDILSLKNIPSLYSTPQSFFEGIWSAHLHRQVVNFNGVFSFLKDLTFISRTELKYPSLPSQTW